MKRTGYSETYTTARGQYRYNYDTEEIEEIGRRVVVRLINGIQAPVTETGIVGRIGIRAEKFDICPEYWVKLWEDMQKGIV